MTTTVTRKSLKSTQSQVALHLMINQLSVSAIPTATRNQSMIVNDIPAELQINADQHTLAAVIGRLLNVIVSHTQNCAIHVSAKPYTNVMLLHLKGQTKMNSPAFALSLNEIQELASHIGGTIGITSYRNEVTTIAFSFIHAGVAA
jgi:glucose-6-phosphate-specific signal transduction histidine kinase